MNGEGDEGARGSQPLPRPWSWTRWITTVGVVMVCQVFLIYLFSKDKDHEVVRDAPETDFVLLPREGAGAEDAVLRAEDPSVFAFANPDGVSGEAWLKTDPLTHELYEWTPDPAWLPPDREGLGGALVEYMEGYAPQRLSMAKKFRPEFRREFQTESVLPSETRVTLHGELTDWILRSRPEMPSIRADTILQPTEVRVVIDGEGRPLSARVVVSSGSGPASEHADRLALETAKGLRFKAKAEAQAREGARGTRASWIVGRVTFHWHTRAPEVPRKPDQGQ